MKNNRILHLLENGRNGGRKSIAVLIDPDKTEKSAGILEMCLTLAPDYFLVGGSLKGESDIAACIQRIRSISSAPVILFPGNAAQVSGAADGILLLSVISSRNPDLLIGKHVEAAMSLKSSALDIVPTGYILVESGKLTSVQYVSQSLPVPRTKPEIAAVTALAGEQLGLQAIYLEAGSGADETVPAEMITAVRNLTSSVLFCGGGITTGSQFERCLMAGADIAVVGNVLESNPALFREFVEIRNKINA